jgi:hypothetical protein
MSFIQRELDRIGTALRQSQPGLRYSQLYAAQQALSWTIEPEIIAAPFDTIVEVTSGTVEDSKDCLAACYQA